MKYCGDSTVEKLERGYACKTRGHVAVPVRTCAIRCARTCCGARGRDTRREGAMRSARTHLCQIICQKGVYIALKTSISCRLFDLGVFFASHLAAFSTAISIILPCVLHQNALHLAPKRIAFSGILHCVYHQNALYFAANRQKTGVSGGRFK